MKGSLNQACAGELAWTAQINIWVMLADLYLKMDKPMQAVSSIDEAAQIAAAHPEVLFYVCPVPLHEFLFILICKKSV